MIAPPLFLGILLGLLVSTVTSTAIPLTAHRSAPQFISSPHARNQVALANCASLGFSVPLTIGSGSSAQTFHVILDTGSGIPAVASSSCSNCAGATPTYSPATSATDYNSEITVEYGQGSWTGDAYSDTLTLGTSSVVGVLFAAITTHSSSPMWIAPRPRSQPPSRRGFWGWHSRM